MSVKFICFIFLLIKEILGKIITFAMAYFLQKCFLILIDICLICQNSGKENVAHTREENVRENYATYIFFFRT